MRCQKKLIEVYRKAGGGLATVAWQCTGTLNDEGTCSICRGTRGVRRRGAVSMHDRFVERVALLEEAAQQLLDATKGESEEAEALGFALKQMREPTR
jgi:hypothetical protein